MNDNDGLIWALAILFGLSALVPVMKIKQSWGTIKRKAIEEQNARALSERQDKKRQAYLRESIAVLAKSMLDDQVELSEGCLRIKVLVDHYDSRLHDDPKFAVFMTMHDKLEAHPRFEARKAVDKKFLQKLDDARHQIELTHREEIKQASRDILGVVS